MLETKFETIYPATVEIKTNVFQMTNAVGDKFYTTVLHLS